jgi:hypothetical protein
MPEKAHRCGRHALAGNAPACGPELQPVVKPEGSGYRLVMMISGASHRRAKVRVAAWAVMKAMIACQTLFRDGSLRVCASGPWVALQNLAPTQTSIAWPGKTLSDFDALVVANEFMNFILRIQRRDTPAPI